MSREEKETNTDKSQQADEPQATYRNKPFVVFDSLEEMDEYDAKESAALSHDERMEQAERLRKMVYSEYLQEDDSWPPLTRKFKIMPPYINEAGK